VLKNEEDKSMDGRRFSLEVVKLVHKYFGRSKLQLWEPFFDEARNEVRVLNNIASCFYICGDNKIAREFFNIGMTVNAKAEQPDPVIIYNSCILEGEIGGAQEDVGLVPLNCLEETPERNTLIFALQLKQSEYFSNSFYLNRRFNRDFFRNQTISTVLEKSYDFLKEKKDQMEFQKRILFNQYVRPADPDRQLRRDPAADGHSELHLLSGQ